MRENSSGRGLVVVDVQVRVMESCVDSAAVVARIAGLVEEARGKGIPVIWVRHRSDELVPDSAGWQIVPELVPAPGEPIVEKTYGDAFAETDLSERLAEVGATSVVLCGAQTDACIRSTLFGGLHRGYPVTLVGDAHTTEDLQSYGVGYSPEQAAAVLNAWAAWTRLPGVSGSVMSAKEVFAG
ncbi:MAG: isochorismatase family protein [Actinobacteria bacterium]|nr:isochorismatase family protein [Actinomycetota bacterium]